MKIIVGAIEAPRRVVIVYLSIVFGRFSYPTRQRLVLMSGARGRPSLRLSVARATTVVGKLSASPRRRASVEST